MKKEQYKPGEVFIYQNGDRIELGIVKRVNDRVPGHYFAWFNVGDTAAGVGEEDMHKIANGYAFRIVRLDPDGNERLKDL